MGPQYTIILITGWVHFWQPLSSHPWGLGFWFWFCFVSLPAQACRCCYRPGGESGRHGGGTSCTGWVPVRARHGVQQPLFFPLACGERYFAGLQSYLSQADTVCRCFKRQGGEIGRNGGRTSCMAHMAAGPISSLHSWLEFGARMQGRLTTPNVLWKCRQDWKHPSPYVPPPHGEGGRVKDRLWISAVNILKP